MNINGVGLEVGTVHGVVLIMEKYVGVRNILETTE